MQKIFVGKRLALVTAILLVGGHVQAQEVKDTLILNLDRALEIALSDNPKIKE